MQSIWCDFIQDEFLDKEFSELLASKVSGATSNPSIFKNAIATDANYKKRLEALPANMSAEEKFLELACADIKKAALKMAHIHAANPKEGFISFEISPKLANDYAASIDAALRVADKISMPNLMIKLPATKAGIAAMRTLAAKGLNINATLIFSPQQAYECASALAEGYIAYLSQGNTKSPEAVVSIFVSRFDSALNKDLGQKFKLGIENAIVCASYFTKLPNIRALFASTGVKDPSLAKDYYMQELYFQNTVNTAPLDAINAFVHKPSTAYSLSDARVQAAKEFLATIPSELLKSTYEKLLIDGLKQFEIAHEEIMELLK